MENLKANNIDLNNARVLIKGITFKENIPDARNSKVADLYNALKLVGISVFVEDNHADFDDVYNNMV